MYVNFFFWLSFLLQELKNLIPKSAVGTLSSNSSNVIKLIIDAYNVSWTAQSSRDLRLSLMIGDWFSIELFLMYT